MREIRPRAYFDNRGTTEPDNSILGRIYRRRAELSDPTGTHGFIDWLIYAILGLISTVFALWNAYFGNRITKVEVGNKELLADIARHDANIHAVELAIATRFMDHEKEERDRDSLHAAEVAREFKELRKDVNDGHSAILAEVNKLAREVRNGNGNGNGNGRKS